MWNNGIVYKMYTQLTYWLKTMVFFIKCIEHYYWLGNHGCEAVVFFIRCIEHYHWLGNHSWNKTSSLHKKINGINTDLRTMVFKQRSSYNCIYHYLWLGNHGWLENYYSTYSLYYYSWVGKNGYNKTSRIHKKHLALTLIWEP